MGKGKPRHLKLVADDEVYKWFATYFCGCGDPDEAMQSFREILDWYKPSDNRSDHVSLDTLKEFEATHGEGLTLVLLYLLGGTRLAEHGGSVYGSWLTPLGSKIKQFLTAHPDYTP